MPEQPPKETALLGTIKRLSVSVPLDPLTTPRISAGWDVVKGMLAKLQADAQPTSNASSLVLARARALEATATGEKSQADSTEYRLGEALAELIGPVALTLGITRDTWASLMPRDVSLVGPESSPTARAADETFGSFAGFTESTINTVLPEGFELDLNDTGNTVDLLDASQDALNIGAGNEDAEPGNTANNLQTALAVGQLVLPLI